MILRGFSIVMVFFMLVCKGIPAQIAPVPAS